MKNALPTAAAFYDKKQIKLEKNKLQTVVCHRKKK